MTAKRPVATRPNATDVRRNSPALAAANLAHAMLNTGWTLSSATVRVVHTAKLADSSGLSIAVSSEAGETRLELDSEYQRREGYLSRSAWRAEATRELPIEVLAAVSRANTIASDDDPTEVAEMLTVAGWSQPYPSDPRWISPNGDREVIFLDEEFHDAQLPWLVHCQAENPVTVQASRDTPAAVIVALALTDAGLHRPARSGRAPKLRR